MSHKGQPCSPLFFAGFRFMQGSGRGTWFESSKICARWYDAFPAKAIASRFRNAAAVNRTGQHASGARLNSSQGQDDNPVLLATNGGFQNCP